MVDSGLKLEFESKPEPSSLPPPWAGASKTLFRGCLLGPELG